MRIAQEPWLKVEVTALGSLTLKVPTVSVDVKQHSTNNSVLGLNVHKNSIGYGLLWTGVVRSHWAAVNSYT